MVEVSEVGLKEEDVELDLGLSIGGSFCRSQKNLPKDLQNQGRNGRPEAMEFMDLKTTREIHALRRLEARRKRENKRIIVRGPESEPENLKRVCKKEEKMDGGSLNLNLNGGDGGGGETVSFQEPYGYVFPCVVPWTVKEKNVGSPVVVGKGFRRISGDGFGWDPHGEDNKKVKSDGSSMCSSSLVSDHQSSSYEGGGSSDSQSQSVQSLHKPTKLNGSKQINMRTQLPEQTTASSHPIKADHTNQPDPKTKPNKQEEPAKKPLPPRPLCHEKPPRPQPHTLHLLMANKMPYVSTTGGKGPNGKRVNGFLYRYNNSEVSIVCVCHGSTFSPAGFVQHAGGTDISHPERHITVINPPAFGS